MSPIFQDDPQAIEKLNAKLEKLQEAHAFWKAIKKTKPRPYDRSLGDQRWYMLTNVSTNIRLVKEKIAKIQKRQEEGKTLERKTTFKNGKKCFFYVEKEIEN